MSNSPSVAEIVDDSAVIARYLRALSVANMAFGVATLETSYLQEIAEQLEAMAGLWATSNRGQKEPRASKSSATSDKAADRNEYAAIFKTDNPPDRRVQRKALQ